MSVNHRQQTQHQKRKTEVYVNYKKYYCCLSSVLDAQIFNIFRTIYNSNPRILWAQGTQERTARATLDVNDRIIMYNVQL